MSPRVSRAEREAQITEAASRVFGRRGYAAASMEEIADEVGLTKPMLYHYFGSKQGLFHACSLRLWQGMGAAILGGATREGSPEQRLWWGIVGYFEFIGAHRDEWRVMYPELGPGGGEAGEQLNAVRRSAVQMMADLFAGAAVEAGVPEELAEMAEAVAYGFTGAATAIAAWWLEHPEHPPEAPAVRMMNLAWRGFERLLEEDVWRPPAHD